MMSPKMLPVTMVSNTLGFLSSCMAALSTYLQDQLAQSEADQDMLRALQLEATSPLMRYSVKCCTGMSAWEIRVRLKGLSQPVWQHQEQVKQQVGWQKGGVTCIKSMHVLTAKQGMCWPPASAAFKISKL